MGGVRGGRAQRLPPQCVQCVLFFLIVSMFHDRFYAPYVSYVSCVSCVSCVSQGPMFLLLVLVFVLAPADDVVAAFAARQPIKQ